MKTEFIKLYESLSALNEAKQDTINFTKWIQTKGAYSEHESNSGAQRFDSIKQYLKAPENDYYYGIKRNDIDDFRRAVGNCEHNLENKKLDKAKVAEGVKLVNETEHGKMYHITNYEASRVYGRDSQGCITGVNNYGDKWGKDYTKKGYSFYFIITKGKYDPRGEDSKFAFAIHEGAECYKIFNQQDDEVDLEDIPHYEEVEIPNINLDDYSSDDYPYFCSYCDTGIDEWDIMGDPSGDPLCDSCGDEKCFHCYNCGTTMFKDDGYEGDGEYYCQDCFNNTFFECSRCGEYGYGGDDKYDEETGEYYCSDCYDELIEEREEEDEMLGDFESEDY